MDSAKLNDWMQIVGIFAVVASLIFVGLQMKQSQAIAISTAYQARNAAAMEMNNALAANETVLTAFSITQTQGLDSLSPEEIGAGRAVIRSIFLSYDNVHYQFENGFIDQESWARARANMKDFVKVLFVRRHIELRYHSFRASF
jgi:hypothetical protein